jgi:hypothetical protein
VTVSDPVQKITNKIMAMKLNCKVISCSNLSISDSKHKLKCLTREVRMVV